MTPTEQIAGFIDECLIDTDCFLVSYKVKPTHNYKVYIDSDSGFTLEKCIRINRRLRKMIEEAALYPEGDFSIEVSSPGIDAPLTMRRQYVKNIGRKLEIELTDEEAKGITGRLLEADEERIKVEPVLLSKRPKKTDVPPESIEIRYEDIKKATVCIEF
ncbi:MAG: ribosome maturation factor [Chitinophagaceae bacterium]|nr:ribosome maturation factor [Chitinophagaceae bacterium]